MDALAGTWFLSGKKTDDLYGGKTEEIVKELREWVKARLARNKAIIPLLWDFFKIVDTIALLGQQYGSQDARIDPFKAKYVKNLERVKVRQFHLFEIARTEPASQEAKEDRHRQYQRAVYLITTLIHRGFEWPGIPCRSQWSEVDSEVCAFLQSQDSKFNAEKQLEVLEMEEAFEKWHLENASRAPEEASEIAESNTEDNDLTPNVRSAASVSVRIQGCVSGNIRGDQFPDPFDLRDLVPPPCSYDKDSPTGALTPIFEGSGEDEDSESEELPEETPEAIAERLNRVLTIEPKPKVEKKSKTKIRNAQRRKAKARAKEAAKAPSLIGDDEHSLQRSKTDD